MYLVLYIFYKILKILNILFISIIFKSPLERGLENGCGL